MNEATDIVIKAACLWLALLIGRALWTGTPTMEAEDSFAARQEIEQSEPMQLPPMHAIRPAFEPVKEPPQTPLASPPQPATPELTDQPKETSQPARESLADSALLPQKPAPASASILRVHKTFSHAQAVSHDTGRPVWGLFVGPPGTCPRCDEFKRKVLSNPQVIDELNAVCEVSIVDGEEEPALADAAKVTAYPDCVLVWPDKRRPRKFLLPVDPDEFLANLAQAMKGS